MDELTYLSWIRGQVEAKSPVLLGVGDDAAAIGAGGDEPWLVTTDTVLEGVDFHLSNVGHRLAGRKAMAVCLSDIAAMGGRPTVALATVAAPRRGGEEALKELFLGMRDVADEFDVQIVGGDFSSWGGELAVSVVCLGRGDPVPRSGARAGDAICVTGALGGSILGKHLRFTPRVREAAAIRRRCTIHSMIDVSDGLSRDLHHLLEASGVGAVIEADAVPVSPEARKLSRESGKDPLDHALGDGEDFELLFSLPESEARGLCEGGAEGTKVTRIGRVVETGCSIERGGGVVPLPPMGYVHEIG